MRENEGPGEAKEETQDDANQAQVNSVPETEAETEVNSGTNPESNLDPEGLKPTVFDVESETKGEQEPDSALGPFVSEKLLEEIESIPNGVQVIIDQKLVNRIAKTCHNVNKAYCEAIGDDSQPAWEDAPAWQIRSAIKGVIFHIERPNAGHADSHNSWAKEKIAAGWRYGEEKDPEALTHPCLVPFNELPAEQQVKDALFKAVVDSLRLQ